MKNLFKYLPSFLFCGFIFTFMVLWIALPKEDFSQQEKRELAKFPEFNAETLFSGDFQKSLDTYMSDHTPARNFFIGLNADFALISGRNGYNGISMGQDGKYTDSDCIALGSDGYLFAKPTRGTKLMENAGYIKEYAESSDIPVYMTVVPSSGSVNTGKLPYNHPEYKDFELIGGVIDTVGDKVGFVDLRDTFRSLSDEEQLYYRTDHHWTSKGAYECYKLLGKKMGFDPVSEDDFDKEEVSGFYGTSYARAALWFVEPDSLELWHNEKQPDGSVSVQIVSGGNVEKENNDYFFRDKLDRNDKYEVYLDGVHGCEKIVNNNVKDGTLIVVKDSYGHTIVPFLSQNYHKIIMVDLRYYKKAVSDIADEENADAVLVLYSLDNLSTDPYVNFLE